MKEEEREGTRKREGLEKGGREGGRKEGDRKGGANEWSGRRKSVR